MLSIKRVRELLSDEGKNMSDEKVEEIRDEFYNLSNIIFEKWLEERRLKKKNKR